jgi:hypothetical protein
MLLPSESIFKLFNLQSNKINTPLFSYSIVPGPFKLYKALMVQIDKDLDLKIPCIF